MTVSDAIKGPVAPVPGHSHHNPPDLDVVLRLASGRGVGTVAMLAVGLPWYIAMYMIHKDAFVQGFLVANNLSRFLKPENAAQSGHWYSCLANFPVLLILFLPWSVFLPQAIARNWRVNDGAKLASVWFGVVFVFFSLSKTMLPTYIFPLYPAAAIRGHGMRLRLGLGLRGLGKAVVVLCPCCSGRLGCGRTEIPRSTRRYGLGRYRIHVTMLRGSNWPGRAGRRSESAGQEMRAALYDRGNAIHRPQTEHAPAHRGILDHPSDSRHARPEQDRLAQLGAGLLSKPAFFLWDRRLIDAGIFPTPGDAFRQ